MDRSLHHGLRSPIFIAECWGRGRNSEGPPISWILLTSQKTLAGEPRLAKGAACQTLGPTEQVG